MTVGSGSTVRLAAIGVGYWGRALADGVKASGIAKVVSCFAPTTAHCEEFATGYGCRIAPGYEAVLSDPEVEGILLTTPNSLHRRQVEAAAAHGKHVFVEKPIALSIADGQAATRACAAAGVTLAVGHQSRRQAGIRRLKTLIETGELGEIIGVEANISTDSGTRVNPDAWRWNRTECPGGPLIQIGIHHIDSLCYLLGPISRVYGVQRHRVIPAAIDDASVTLLEFENGVIGHLTSHYATARAVDIRIMGTKANACYDMALGLHLRRDAQGQVVREQLPLPANDPICEEITEFATCIRSGSGSARPEVGGEAATLALAVVLAAVESGRRGCAVPIAEILGTSGRESCPGC